MTETEKRTAFVTGATGFTGGYLCRNLVGRGYRVKALVRPGRDTAELENLGIEIVHGDLTDPDSLAGKMDGVDVVFHIAAVYRQEGIPRSEFWRVNVDGTRHMLDEALRSGVKRFVHCSTVGVQGEIKNPPATEEAPYNPGDWYQESKMEGELLALSYFKEKGLPVTIVRPVGIYGPGDTRFLKIFRHINKGTFRMIGSGKVLYHLTFVEDLVEGIALAGEKENAVGQIYTIGGEEYVTLNELVELIAGILGKKVPRLKIPVWPVWTAGLLCEWICRPLRIEPPIFRRRVDFFIKDRAFDISKAKRELGYQPKVPLKKGLEITARWYKEQGWLD
jgi:nucleoside-diphosphate-sugar epimerase